MAQARKSQLLEACRLLFGHDLDEGFLEQLRESGVKVAYRRRALDTHPDRIADRAAKRVFTERFIETQRAYALLREFVALRDRRHARPGPSRTAQRASGPPPGKRPRPDVRPRPHNPQKGLPRRPLRLGEFLYYSRAISFQDLIEALVWQRRQRPRFGDVLRRWGYLREEEIRLLLNTRHPLERLGEAALRLRLMTDFQVRTVVCFQLRTQLKLGAFFLESGRLRPRALEQLLRGLRDHNAAHQPRR